MLKHRFGRSADNARVLDFEVRFINSGFFQQNLLEVFDEGEYFIDLENPRPVIVDCGANIGLATLFFKRLFPGSSITAIEAHPETFKVLEANIRANNLDDVTVLNVALTDSDVEEIELYSSPVVGDLRATANREFYPDGGDTPTTHRVRAARLSTLLPEHTDLLKMDIEGAEVAVIRDISDKLPAVDNIIMEFHSLPEQQSWSLGKMLTFLEDAGFKCVVRGMTHQPISTYIDLPFANIIFATRR
jgi:FkbM family methyltransferase